MLHYGEIEKEELREFLSANWITHDAMWVTLCAREFGMEKTNLVNREAARSMAAVEAKRLKKLLRIRTVRTYDEVKRNETIRSD